MNYRHYSKLNYILYQLISLISYLIRYILCYLTIESIPIFESEAMQWIYSITFGGLIYTVFWSICYPLVRLISNKFDITHSYQKSLLYFFLYLPLILVSYLILKELTVHGLLPINMDTAFNLWEFLAQKFSDLIMFLFNFIASITEGISTLSIL